MCDISTVNHDEAEEYFGSVEMELDHFCSDDNYIYRICDSNNLFSGIKERAVKVFEGAKRKLPKRSDLHLSLYAIYQASLKENVPYTIEEVAGMGGLSVQLMSRLVKSISKSTGYTWHYDNNVSYDKYLDRYVGSIISSSKDRSRIRMLLEKLPGKLKSCNLKTILAGTVYYYATHKTANNVSRQMVQDICSLFCIKLSSARNFSVQLSLFVNGK